MALPMTDKEIRISYRDAKTPAAQIYILAELNATQPRVIKAIVEGVHPVSMKRKYARLDEDAAKRMHDEGATTGEIAKALDVAWHTVYAWKRRAGITPPASSRR